MELKAIVGDGKLARFSHYRDGNFFYIVEVEGKKYSFPISLEEAHGGTWLAEFKAITLMRWIRKALDVPIGEIMRLTLMQVRALNLMVNGRIAFESIGSGAVMVLISSGSMVSINPRTLRALAQKGCVERSGKMLPISMRQGWEVTRLGEIELFNRSK